MSKQVDKQKLLDGLNEWKKIYAENGYNQHEFAINGVINRVKSKEYDAPDLLAERDAEIQRLRKEIAQTLVSIGNAYEYGYLRETDEGDVQRMIDRLTSALSHQAEQPDTKHTEFKFPRQPSGEGGWVIAPEYLESIIHDIEHHYDEDTFGFAPSLEQTEMVLLAVERLSQPAPKGEDSNGQ